MNAKHTPGPWAWENNNPEEIGEEGGQLVASSGEVLIETDAGFYGPHGLATRALIAAAPDLLAALEACVTEDGARCLAYGSDTPTLRRRIAAINEAARAAIAKARGE
jgi:hypothetical protein